MFRVVVLFCAALTLTKGYQTTQVSQCLAASSGPLPINAHIAGCDTQPCGLPQGQDAVVQIVFRAPYNIHRMRTVAMAYLPLIPFPFDYGLAERAETCNFLDNTYCPVVKDEVISYTLRMPIEDFMVAGTQLPIEFRIQDDSNRFIMCIRVQLVILPPLNNKLGNQNSTVIVGV